LVGEGPLKNSIQEWVCAAGLSSNVHFLGKRADVLAIMKQCDVLVLPSLIEGLPGVILEAMAVRLPVVAYDIGGISEVIHTETGWLVPKSDEKAFAGSVWEVLQGASEPREIKLNRAYQLVADHFQHKQVVGYFEKLYQDVLQSRWINCN
jgi:glycosyltransferase involved in cell wall biosynthesis